MTSFTPLLLLAFGLTPRPGPLFPVTSAAEARNLSSTTDGKARAVALRGVVTYIHPTRRELFVQDLSGAVVVSAVQVPDALAVGDEVELRGTTRLGDGGASVVNATIVRLGPAAQTPKPDPFDLSFARAEWFDSRVVTARGTVRSISHTDGFTLLKLQAGGGEAVALFPDPPAGERLDHWIGAEVRVNGVCAAIAGSPERRATPRILLPSFRDVVELRATEPAIPTVSTDEIADRATRTGTARSVVRVVGVVTAVWNGRVLFVQDPAGGVAAELVSETSIAPGARVEVIGTPAVAGRTSRLLYAKATSLGVDGPQPDPVPVPRDHFGDARYFGRLVRIEGRITDVTETRNGFRIGVTDGGPRIEAFVMASASPDEIRPGAWVALVGTCSGYPVAGDSPEGYELIIRSPEDVTHLRAAPSWWSARGARLTAAGVGFTGLLGVVWLVALRTRLGRFGLEVKREQVERDRLEEQLQQAAKLEAVGRLAGGIAHDFNNILTVINGCAELLAEDPVSPKAGELVDDIRRAGNRGATLAAQLLTFSRKRVVSHHPVDLNEIVSDATRLLARVIGEDITVRLFLEPGLPALRADAGMLTQVVMNLALNGRDAMPNGGVLTITTSFSPVASDPQSIRLGVMDTGIGMTPAVRARIFDAFYTTKDAGKGTGLGLSIVSGIVQALGGTIDCTSTEGIGTTFDVDFPLIAPGVSTETEHMTEPGSTPEADPHPTPPVPMPALSYGVVLLIEDDPAVRLLGQRVLELHGLTVLPAEGADEALDLCENHQGPIDVVLTDVVMPGGSGTEVAEQVRTIRPGVRVVFMSGYNIEEVERRGGTADVGDFLQKPFTPAGLLEKVIAALGR